MLKKCCRFQSLVVQLPRNAILGFSKGKFKTGAIFHSDLGSQYTSNKVERYLKDLDLKHSYSKKGYTHMIMQVWRASMPS